MTFLILFDFLKISVLNIFFYFLLPTTLFSQSNIEITPLSIWSDTSLLTNSTQVRYSGCWGFNWQNNEYAVIGSTEGSHFFQIDNSQLLLIDSITADYVSSQAITREFKFYDHYIFASSDEGSGSFQIIDISYLPDSVHLVKTFRNELLAKVHNQWVDSINHLLFACSVTPFLDPVDGNFIPLRVFDISNPLDPILLWDGPDDVFEVHDIYVDTSGVAILNCGYEGMKIMNFSNPSSPIQIQNISVYNEQGYNHQGSITENNEYYIFGDETPGTRLKKATIHDDFTLSINTIFGRPNEPYDKTPHNITCSNNFAYVAYYNEGLRIYDLRSDPPSELAFFDTHSDLLGNTFSMWGAWGIYRFKKTGNILLSDRIGGLFLFNFQESNHPLVANEEFQVFPNPSVQGTIINYIFPLHSEALKIIITDTEGSILYENNTPLSSDIIQFNFSQGIYLVNCEYLNEWGDKKTETKKILVMN